MQRNYPGPVLSQCVHCTGLQWQLHQQRGPSRVPFRNQVRRLPGYRKSEAAGVTSQTPGSAPDGLCLELQSPEQVIAKWLWQQLAGPLKSQPSQNTPTTSASTTWVMSPGHGFPFILKATAAKLVCNGTICLAKRQGSPWKLHD